MREFRRTAQTAQLEQYFTQQVNGMGKRRRRRRRGALVAVALALAGVLVGTLVFLWPGTGGGVAMGGTVPPAAVAATGPYVIALDAGHGGHDVGAEGLIREVELTEAVVRELEALLAADPEYAPVLCRPYGGYATLDERAQTAGEAGAALLLSVHGNSDPVYNSSGFECYPTPPGRRHNVESLRFGLMLAEEVAAAGSPLRGENGVRYMYFEERKNGETDRVIREASDTNVYDAPSYGMVEKPACPAVLAELCFVTNQDDMARFGTQAGYRLAALCYYKAICRFFGTTPLAG